MKAKQLQAYEILKSIDSFPVTLSEQEEIKSIIEVRDFLHKDYP